MPRENSFSDSEGRSLTPDLEEENDFDMGPGSLTTSPVAENPLNGQSRFDYPTLDSQPTANGNGSVTPSVLNDPQQPSQVESTAAAVPSRKATNATVYSTNGMPTNVKPPLERFRASVRKVIHMKRGSSALTLGGAGAEPGVDPRRSSANLNYGHLHAKCTIDIVDYNAVSILTKERKSNEDFVEFVTNPKKFTRQSWVKVRWINIGGISWDVIKTVALAYGTSIILAPGLSNINSWHVDLHPLALEDVLHQRPQARSKADYYLKHLFIRVLRHTLREEDDEVIAIHHNITHLPRSASPENMHDRISEEEEDEFGMKELGEADEDKTLAGSKFSTRRKVGSFRKATAGKDVEMGKIPERGRSISSGSILVCSVFFRIWRQP